MITLFAALSAGAKTYLRCNFSIFFFSDLTERLDGCLYKCGCLVKLSILMSMIRKNSFFQSLRACTPTPSFLDQRLQYVWSASSTIFRHLVKLTLDGSLYLGPFLKSDRNPLSGIQVRSPVTTCPAGGYRKGESARDHDGWMELASYFVKIIWFSRWFCNPPPYFEAVYCFICGRLRVAVARYRMICLVLFQNIGIRSYLVVVENYISNKIFVLIANKRRVKILEILRDFRGDSMIPENVGNIKQVQALINELNFDKLSFRRKCWYARKEFIKRKAIIILSLNQSECLKLLRSASSRIGFSRDTGIEESACKSSCRPLFLAIRRRWSKDLFNLCFLLERPLRRTPWDRRFLQTSGFNEKTLIIERMDDIFPCW